MPNFETSSTQTSTPLVSVAGQADYSTNPYIQFVVEQNKGKGINPSLYFNYVKKKFSFMEQVRMDRRLKKIEKAFYKAIENGQEALAEKFLHVLAVETREAVLYTKGIRQFINKDELNKYKRSIRDGHIADTTFEGYTRCIPPSVLKKKKELEKFFDGFVIYHSWIYEVEKKREKKQKITEKEKAKMKDPILFGWIKENPDVLYHIDSWEDELCDLSFDELVDVLGKEREDITLKKDPELVLD